MMDGAASQIDELSKIVLSGFNGVGVGLSGSGETEGCVVKACDEEQQFCGSRS
jgi:hypothetical protein